MPKGYPGSGPTAGKNKRGAPRTVTPEPDELIKLGQEMVAWVKEHNPLHLNMWFSVEKGILWETFKAYIQKPEFLPYYEQARALVAKNYMNGTVNPSIAHRFIRIYCKDVKEEENEQLELQHKLKTQADKLEKSEDYKIAEQLNKDLIKQIADAQGSLNKDSSNINNDNMS